MEAPRSLDLRRPSGGPRPRRRALPLGLALALGLAACDGPSPDGGPTPPADEPSALPDIPARPVSARFTLRLDTKHPSLARALLDPLPDAVTVTGDAAAGVALTARAKRVPARPELVWIELFFENRGTDALRDVRARLEVAAGTALYDLTNDPFAEATAERTLRVGGIGPEGIGRLAIGLPAATPLHELKLELTATTTRRVSTASAPLAMAPDGSEVWAALPDGDRVGVISTATDTLAAALPIPGRPSSVAITADGRLVVVASPQANQVTVLRRDTREVVQILGESDGIGREPRHVVLSPDGSRLFVSAYVGDTVTAFTRSGLRFSAPSAVAVGRRPVGMAVAPDGQTLLVSHYLPRGTTTRNEGFLSVLSTSPLAKAREVTINDPLNLDVAHCLSDLFMLPPLLFTTEGVPSQLAGVFLEPGGSRAIVPGMRAGSGAVFERGPKAVSTSDLTTPRPGEFTAPFLFYLDTREPAAATRMLARAMVERPVDTRYPKCAQFGEESEATEQQVIPGKPDQVVPRFPAFPGGVNSLSGTGIRRFVGYSRGGRLALTLSYNSDEISVMDAVTNHPVAVRGFLLKGSNPTGIVLSPDGRRGYVSYANSLFVSVVDLSAYAEPLPRPSFVPYEYREVPELPAPGLPGAPNKQLVRYVSGVPQAPPLRELKQVALVDKDPLDPRLRRGKILFESSNPEKHPKLTPTRIGACGVCHPSGGNDGFMWGTMEGERRTMSLYGGVAGRGWLHASGTHKDVSEFADAIVRERLGGDLPAEDRDALARYVAHGIPRLQTPKVDAALAARGKEAFEKTCGGCHRGAQLTSGNPDPASPLGGGQDAGPMLYDVGTATSDAHVILAPFFERALPKPEAEILAKLRGDRDLGAADPLQTTLDFRPRPDRKRGLVKAPSLVNVWDNVVFFHDGRFDKLEDAVRFMSALVPAGVSAEDQRAIVEYLKTL